MANLPPAVHAELKPQPVANLLANADSQQGSNSMQTVSKGATVCRQSAWEQQY